MRQATPTKLEDGTWGARVEGTPFVGGFVWVRTSAGKTWLARVTQVIWSGGGVSICRTTQGERAAKADRQARARRGRRNAVPRMSCRSCGGALVDAPHHDAMDGYCGACAFDEYDI